MKKTLKKRLEPFSRKVNDGVQKNFAPSNEGDEIKRVGAIDNEVDEKNKNIAVFFIP